MKISLDKRPRLVYLVIAMKKNDARQRALNHYIKVENMRVETIAREIGVSTRTIYNWSDGKSRISPLAETRVDRFLKKAKRIVAMDTSAQVAELISGGTK
jgi:uncharacterized protein YjcR